MSTGDVKIILGEPWENHRVGTTVSVDRSRGSWLLSKGGRAANAESARSLGVAWVEPKAERRAPSSSVAKSRKVAAEVDAAPISASASTDKVDGKE